MIVAVPHFPPNMTPQPRTTHPPSSPNPVSLLPPLIQSSRTLQGAIPHISLNKSVRRGSNTSREPSLPQPANPLTLKPRPQPTTVTNRRPTRPCLNPWSTSAHPTMLNSHVMRGRYDFTAQDYSFGSSFEVEATVADRLLDLQAQPCLITETQRSED
jgi:hypothetical protein